ncbi:hypothetical protein BLNAU_3743 [Blattamonas nauphoetae]|uniref:CSC1/OSCA1-like cytosolic domain-containing protein n=1 Tax=Blattamonas nauphoetae TaxID=2049346 RepID=A0ABQ9YC22_9EUKA|nr:hypothetical protein BLNAU_3743 [Blattamonas nauphoetae]
MSRQLPDVNHRTRYQKLSIAKKVRIAYQLNTKNLDARFYSESHRYKLSTSLSNVTLGSGIMNFFKIEKTLAKLFWILTIIAIGELLVNMLFAPFSEGNNVLLFITLGNYVVAASQSAQTNPKLYFIFITVALELSMLVVLTIFIFYLKRQLAETNKLPIGKFQNVSDYSVFVENIPRDIKSADDIATHFNQFAPVHSVLLIYDVEDYGANQTELNRCIENYHLSRLSDEPTVDGALQFRTNYMTTEMSIIDSRRAINPNPPKGSALLRKLGLLKDEEYWFDRIETLVQSRASFTDPKQKPTTGCAFVTFSDSWAQERVLSIYRDSDIRNCIGVPVGQKPMLMINNRVIFVSKAPAPSDMIFSNVGISLTKRRASNTIVFLITFLIVAAGVAIITFIRLKVREVSDFVVSTLISLGNTLVSKTIQFTVLFLQRFSFPLTFSGQQSQASTRLFLADFGMNALTLFFLSVLIKPIPFQGSFQTYSPRFYILSPDWFSTIVMMFLTNILIDIAIVILLEITQIVSFIFKIPTFLSADTKPQSSLNNAYLPSEWPAADRLAQIVKIEWICLMVSVCAPFLVPLLALFYTVQFFVDKRNILRVYAEPKHFGTELTRTTVQLLTISLHMHALITVVIFFVLCSTDVSLTANPAKLWPAFAYLMGYAVLLIFLVVQKMIQNTRHQAAMIKEKRWIEYRRKRGETYPMSDMENYVETYVDTHPLYSPLTHYLTFTPNSECRQEIPVFGLSSLNLAAVHQTMVGLIVEGVPKFHFLAGPESENRTYYSFYSQTPYFRRRRRKAPAMFVQRLVKQPKKILAEQGKTLVDMDTVARQGVKKQGVMNKLAARQQMLEQRRLRRHALLEWREERREEKKLAYLKAHADDETPLDSDFSFPSEAIASTTEYSKPSDLSNLTLDEVEQLKEFGESDSDGVAPEKLQKEKNEFDMRFNREYQQGVENVTAYKKQRKKDIRDDTVLNEEENLQRVLIQNAQRVHLRLQAYEAIRDAVISSDKTGNVSLDPANTENRFGIFHLINSESDSSSND